VAGPARWVMSVPGANDVGVEPRESDVAVAAGELAEAARRWREAYQAWESAVRRQEALVSRYDAMVLVATGGLGLVRWRAACRRRRVLTVADAKPRARALRARPAVEVAVARRRLGGRKHSRSRRWPRLAPRRRSAGRARSWPPSATWGQPREVQNWLSCGAWLVGPVGSSRRTGGRPSFSGRFSP
jgi:hypothetical protein